MAEQDDGVVASVGGFKIMMRCDAAAPLVANGGGFVGCQLPKDHVGAHEVKITWK